MTKASSLLFHTGDEAETVAFGRSLGKLLRAGDVVGLDGPLGTGKTRVAAGIAAALGVVEPITSPTFGLIHEYDSVPPLAHVDAYRLADTDEFLALGVSEMWEDGVVVVEWASRVEEALPRDTLRVTGRALSHGEREWTVLATVPGQCEELRDLAAHGR